MHDASRQGIPWNLSAVCSRYEVSFLGICSDSMSKEELILPLISFTEDLVLFLFSSKEDLILFLFSHKEDFVLSLCM
jgi:hypothetical protein